MQRLRSWIFLCSQLAATLLLAGLPAPGTAAELSVAVVPRFTPEKLFELWAPLLREVSRRSGVKLELVTYRSIPEFERSFRRAEPDIAYMNPYHVVMSNRAQGYTPFLRDGDRPLHGILVVRADSQIQSVRELDGVELAFPAPNAFGASLYLRALLHEKEGIRFIPRYVSTHANVYRSVILGKVAAGGGVDRTLEKESAEIRGQLRVLYRTPPALTHPLAAHPRVAATTVDAVRDAFESVASDPRHGKLMQDIQFARPRRTDLSEYLPLQQLGIEKFVVPASR